MAGALPPRRLIGRRETEARARLALNHRHLDPNGQGLLAWSVFLKPLFCHRAEGSAESCQDDIRGVRMAGVGGWGG